MREGWVCPRCKRSMSPDRFTCFCTPGTPDPGLPPSKVYMFCYLCGTTHATDIECRPRPFITYTTKTGECF